VTDVETLDGFLEDFCRQFSSRDFGIEDAAAGVR
jgi:hypothetical protein